MFSLRISAGEVSIVSLLMPIANQRMSKRVSAAKRHFLKLNWSFSVQKLT